MKTSCFALSLLGAFTYAQQDFGYWPDDFSSWDFGNDGEDDLMQSFYDTVAEANDMEKMMNEDMVEFGMFAAAHNKQYKTRDEFRLRESNWKRSQLKVKALNLKSKGNSSYDLNEYSDYTDDEFYNMTGLSRQDDDHWSRRRLLEDDQHRRLKDKDYYVNWVALKKTSGVKEQGVCGACWSFCGTIALEAQVAIRDGVDAVRLSEQQGVDCTTNSDENKARFGKTYNTWGCEGGWMNRYWNFSRDQGSMLYSDYPYTGKDGNCQHDPDKIVARAGESGQVTTSITAIKEKLLDGPLTAAVAAGNNCWRYYKSGVIDAEMNCPKTIDHAVVIVGHGYDVTKKQVQKPDKYRWSCKKMTKKEKNKKQCSSDSATLYRSRYCCEKKFVEKGEVEEEEVNKDYWLIQNSWSDRWGEKGLIKLAVEGGYGISGINQVVEYVGIIDL